MGVAMGGGEEGERLLHFIDKLVQVGPKGQQDALEVGGLSGVAFEVLGLGKGELEVLGQSTGKAVAANRDGPLPDHALAIADHQVRTLDSDIEGNDALFLAPLGLSIPSR